MTGRGARESSIAPERCTRAGSTLANAGALSFNSVTMRSATFGPTPGVRVTAALSRNAIVLRDKAAVTRTPGVGPKVAERIVTELKDKAPAFANVDPALVHLSGAIDDARAPRPVTDAISALVNLGYGQPQAAAAIASASRSAGENAETAQLIRLGLKELAK